MIFTRDAIETKSHMRHSRAVRLERRPNAVEVPSVRDKTDSQTGVADEAKCFVKLGMERWLAAGETDPRHVSGYGGFIDHTFKQREREEFGV
jgi:hypothetical protein